MDRIELAHEIEARVTFANDAEGRVRLLHFILAEPDETVATCVTQAKRSRPELRHADFEEILEQLRAESDERVRRAIRGGARRD